MKRSVPGAFLLRSCAPALLLALAVGAGLGCQGSIDERLARIRDAQEAGDFADTVGELRQVLADQPDHPEANYLLGIALLRTGQSSPAIWPLRKAYESESYAVDAGILLAQTLQATRNPEEAVPIIERVTELDPDNIEAWRTRARAEGAAHRYREAEASANKLLELEPKSPGALMLRAAAQLEIPRVEASEASFAEARAAAKEAGNLPLASEACIAQARLRLDPMKDEKGSRSLFEECLAEAPVQPGVVSMTAQFFSGIGEPDRAEKIWRDAAERAPENLTFQIGLGRQLAASGKLDEAKRVIEEAAKDFKSLEAWSALAELHRGQGDLAAAHATLEKAREGVGDSDLLRFQRADLLIELDRTDEAEALAREIEDRTYADAVRGRVLQKRGDAAGALEAYDASLVRWPNNAAIRFLAGQAAESLGRYDRALEEYKQAIRSDQHATDAGLAAAYLSYSLGQPVEALEFAAHQVRGRPYKNPEPFVIAARAAMAADRKQVASDWLKALEAQEGGKPTAVAERARLMIAPSDPAAALKAIETSGVDPTAAGSETLLRTLVDLELALGRGERALVPIGRALAARPDSAELETLRGAVLARLERSGEAEAAFRKALEIQPDYGPALAGQAALALGAGDMAKALDLFDRAAKSDARDTESAYRAAQVVLARGDQPEAERRLGELLKRFPGHAGACNDLAWLLAQSGRELDRALDLAQRASKLTDLPEVQDTLASVQLARGETDQAIATLTAALEKKPDAATLRFRLGEALAKKGDAAGARAAYQRALDGGPFPEADQARAGLAKLEGAGAGR